MAIVEYRSELAQICGLQMRLMVGYATDGFPACVDCSASCRRLETLSFSPTPQEIPQGLRQQVEQQVHMFSLPRSGLTLQLRPAYGTPGMEKIDWTGFCPVGHQLNSARLTN